MARGPPRDAESRSNARTCGEDLIAILAAHGTPSTFKCPSERGETVFMLLVHVLVTCAIRIRGARDEITCKLRSLFVFFPTPDEPGIDLERMHGRIYVWI